MFRRSYRYVFALLGSYGLFWQGAALGEPTPGLMTAVVRGDAQAVRGLLENGGEQDVKGQTGRRALLHAAAVGDPQMVRVLLEFGVDPNARAKDKMARTALSVNDWTRLAA